MVLTFMTSFDRSPSKHRPFSSMISLRRSLKKIETHAAIALVARGGGGGLGEIWAVLLERLEALGELLGGLEELLEALYIEKLPINHPSGRYVMCGQRSSSYGL